MILQVASVRADEPTSRLVIPLGGPTMEGTLLVAAFSTSGSVSIVRVLPGRWRQANEMHKGGKRTAYWYAGSGQGGSTEVVAETANATPVTGIGLCIETGGMTIAAALDALSDLIAESRHDQPLPPTTTHLRGP